MSSENIIILSESMKNNQRNNQLKLTYRQEIIKIIIQFAGLFYMVYGVFVTYVWTCKGLDAKSRNNSINNYFWDPVITIYSLGNFSVLILIGWSKWRSDNIEEKVVIKKSENYILACFILIPLFLSSCILNIIKLVRDIAIIPCHGYLEFLVPLSTIGLIIGAAILIFDIGYFSTVSENWFKRLIKSQLIFFTMIGIANILLINVALQHMHIFRQESYNSSYGDRFKTNETCVSKDSTAFTINNVYKSSDKYLKPIYILFCICTLAYLIQSLLQNENQSKEDDSDLTYSSALTSVTELSNMSDENVLNKNEETEEIIEDDGNVSYRLPSASLVFCITFLSLSFLSFIVLYSLRQNPNSSKPSNHKALGSLIFCSFISVVYIIGSGLSVVHIREIKRWPLSSNIRGKVIDKCLIWIGAGGQLGLSMTFISDSIILLIVNEDYATTIALLFMIIFSSCLVIIQTFFQTVQVSLLLDRKWIRPKINSLAESLCPAVGMMGLNMGLLLLSIDQLKSPILLETSGIMFIDMFTSELGCVCETLGILQRLHASLIFASMIIYTHN